MGSGDVLFAPWALAGFDWILDNQEKYDIQVVDNSWGGSGDFVPEGPTTVATREVYMRDIAVVLSRRGTRGRGRTR